MTDADIKLLDSKKEMLEIDGILSEGEIHDKLKQYGENDLKLDPNELKEKYLKPKFPSKYPP